MLADDLQDLGYVDVDSIPVPPLLFAVVTGEETDLGAVGQEMFDLDHIRLRALGAVHIDFVAAWGGHMLRPAQPYNNEPSSNRRPT
jgi:hypothetical protein